MEIINLTLELATPVQKEAGVVDLNETDRQILREWLTFSAKPTPKEVAERAERIVRSVSGQYRTLGGVYRRTVPGDPEHCVGPYKFALIDGPKFLLHPLAVTLLKYGITPLFAITEKTKFQ